MKKISTPLIVLAVVLLSGCQKSDDINNDYLSALSKNGYLKNKSNANIKDCSIQKISYSTGSNNDVLQFTYNSSGDPVSITRLSGGSTGYPNYVFKYDEKNRITDFIGPYSSNTSAEFWHRYAYDAPGNIILDSTYIFPRISNGFPENAYSRKLTFYTYDNKRRIIRDSTVFSNSATTVVHSYVYDDNGNKVGNIYDDQININRTNKLWMFLNRDYSVNNPFKADGYTTSGLPSGFNLSPDGNSFQFLGNVYYKAQISYACDAAL